METVFFVKMILLYPSEIERTIYQTEGRPEKQQNKYCRLACRLLQQIEIYKTLYTSILETECARRSTQALLQQEKNHKMINDNKGRKR